MPQLRIERVPIRDLQVPGFDHMHLVFVPDEANSAYPQDDWFAIEGAFGGPEQGRVLSTLGSNGTSTLPDLNGGLTQDELVGVIGTPGDRGSRILPTSGDEAAQWQTMAAVARDIDRQELPYHAQMIGSRIQFNINSSSVIATLLYSIGIDIAQNLPFGIARTNGYTTLLGSSGDDDLRIENSFVNLVGGGGNDTFHGSDNDSQFERFSGGVGDDEFFWSEGSHTYHGGQLRLDYKQDGDDIVNYSGVGTVSLEINPARVPHRSADIHAVHDTGTDYLLSIERLAWSEGNDTINLGKGLEALIESVTLELGDQASNTQGDLLDFSESDEAIRLVAATNSDLIFAQAESQIDTDVGIWLDSSEWIVGTDWDDAAYLGWGIRGFDGGAGDDLIDAREVTAFDGKSPQGYDIEILGGSGNDTIVSGFGRTLASGGGGSDRFIVSELSNPSGDLNELIIEDASSTDRLFASHNFFNESFMPFEGSELLPLLGAVSQFPGEASFADLPQNQGPFSTGDVRDDFFAFAWQQNNDRFFTDDETQGVIDFAGNIYYNRDGSDLLIHIFAGVGETTELIGANETPYPYHENITFTDTESIVRVVDFQEGDLGIQFYDIGEAEDFDYSVSHGDYTGSIFPNWDENILELTNNGVLTPALDPRPEAPTYDPDDDAPPAAPNSIIGTAQDDVITTPNGNNDVDAGEGDDIIIAQAGDDIIDGGPGADEMDGGAGDDTYYVDSASDTVTEADGGGTDTVIASTNYTLSNNVENLTLFSAPPSAPTAAAPLGALAALVTTLDGTGNELKNTLIGNEESNTLTGLGGDDTLYGERGDDVLIGGAGSDQYLYFADNAEGNNEIIDTGDVTDIDVLYVDGTTQEEISFYQLTATPEDLIIAFDQGGRIEVSGFFDGIGDNTGIDRVDLGREVSWSRSDIETIVSATGPLDNEAPQAGDDDTFTLKGPAAILPASVLLANDRDHDGDPLTIIAVSSDTVDVAASVDINGDIALLTPDGFNGSAILTYTISDGRGGEATAEAGVAVYPNQAPIVAGTVAPQTSQEDSDWTFTLPSGLFDDPDGDTLTLTARLATGANLPSWMTFDADTATFSGQPPENFNGDLSL